MNIDSLLAELLARIPELDWHLSKLGASFTFDASLFYVLPKGLFRVPVHAPTSDYLDEIKDDIHNLASRNNQQDNEQVARYLAHKIHQKINTFVSICSHNNRLNGLDDNQHFFLTKLNSYHKRMESLESVVTILTEQKQALTHRLNQSQYQHDTHMQLTLLRELGELERRLTLASEAYVKALA